MSISADYPHPVNVNGYSCKNCTEVDYAKKHIDPAHPKDGPYGVNARNDPNDPSVRLDGRLKTLAEANSAAAATQATHQATAAGQSLNILA